METATYMRQTENKDAQYTGRHNRHRNRPETQKACRNPKHTDINQHLKQTETDKSHKHANTQRSIRPDERYQTQAQKQEKGNTTETHTEKNRECRG